MIWGQGAPHNKIYLFIKWILRDDYELPWKGYDDELNKDFCPKWTYILAREIWYINIIGLLSHCFTLQPCALAQKTTHSPVTKLYVVSLPLSILTEFTPTDFLLSLLTTCFPKPRANSNLPMKTFPILPKSKWSFSSLGFFVLALKCDNSCLSYLFIFISELVDMNSEGRICIFEVADPIMSPTRFNQMQ